MNQSLKLHFFFNILTSLTSILQDLVSFLQDNRLDLASCNISVICRNLARSYKISLIYKDQGVKNYINFSDRGFDRKKVRIEKNGVKN